MKLFSFTFFRKAASRGNHEEIHELESELTRLQVLPVGVVHYRQTEEQVVWQAVLLDDAGVFLLSHEARQGAKASVADQLRVAQLARVKVDLEVAAGHGRLIGVVFRTHKDTTALLLYGS